MEHPTITFIINGNTYSLCAGDIEAIRKISKYDRQQLITLLETVKQQERLAQVAVQHAADKVKISSQTTTKVPEAGNTLAHQAIKPERLRSGDVDDLMARLIQEEKRNKKPGLTKQSLYKLIGGFSVIVILLVLIL